MISTSLDRSSTSVTPGRQPSVSTPRQQRGSPMAAELAWTFWPISGWQPEPWPPLTSVATMTMWLCRAAQQTQNTTTLSASRPRPTQRRHCQLLARGPSLCEAETNGASIANCAPSQRSSPTTTTSSLLLTAALGAGPSMSRKKTFLLAGSTCSPPEPQNNQTQFSFGTENGNDSTLV